MNLLNGERDDSHALLQEILEYKKLIRQLSYKFNW